MVQSLWDAPGVSGGKVVTPKFASRTAPKSISSTILSPPFIATATIRSLMIKLEVANTTLDTIPPKQRTQHPKSSTMSRLKGFVSELYRRRKAKVFDTKTSPTAVSEKSAAQITPNHAPQSLIEARSVPGSASPSMLTSKRYERSHPRNSPEPFEVRMPIGHFASNRPASPTPKPQTKAYPGPRQHPKAEPGTEPLATGQANRLDEVCLSCGLKRFQCGNAINYSGTDFRKLDRIHVRVEDRDQHRLAQYLEMEANVLGISRARRLAKLHLIVRNGTTEKQVDVWVGLAIDSSTQTEVPIISICNQKKAQIVQNFRDHVDSVRMGTSASAYMVDGSGKCMFGVLLVRP